MTKKNVQILETLIEKVKSGEVTTVAAIAIQGEETEQIMLGVDENRVRVLAGLAILQRDVLADIPTAQQILERKKRPRKTS